MKALKCPKCAGPMSHEYCGDWYSYTDEYGYADYYVTMFGVWSCDAPRCLGTFLENDDEYEVPE